LTRSCRLCSFVYSGCPTHINSYDITAKDALSRNSLNLDALDSHAWAAITVAEPNTPFTRSSKHRANIELALVRAGLSS